jgi:UDPglucose 6-dehydrogenase
LATSVCFINELARLCERTGADAREVERGLKSEGRIGPKAYLSPGAAFAGGTLARDLQFLSRFGKDLDVATPLFDGVLASNDSHKLWLRDKIAALLAGHASPVVAVLGLTYKPGTSTLRRSASLELCAWLHERGARVKAHDPAVQTLPPELGRFIEVCETAEQALTGADLLVVATQWPEYRSLPAATIVSSMRRPQVLDESWFLAQELAGVSNLRYFAPGKASDG